MMFRQAYMEQQNFFS